VVVVEGPVPVKNEVDVDVDVLVAPAVVVVVATTVVVGAASVVLSKDKSPTLVEAQFNVMNQVAKNTIIIEAITIAFFIKTIPY